MPRTARRPGPRPRPPLAQRVVEMRQARGLTQEELAAEAGVSRGHIAKIETGGDGPGVETLQALAVYFGVSMDYLKTGAHPSAPPSAGRFVDDVEQLKILDLWAAIPKAERPRVIRMILAAALEPAEAG